MDPDRYGDLTDEFEQMLSPEASPADGAIIICGMRSAELVAEMLKYLVTLN